MRANDGLLESQYAEVLGAKLHYRVREAEGPTVLFVHGTPSSSYMWRDLMAKMKTGRCIAVDMIGHGNSDFPDITYNQHNQYKYLCEFIRKLKLTDLVIVGHSYGANLGIWYAREYTENVKALAYLEPMLGAFKSYADFNPHSTDTQNLFRNFRDDVLGHDLIVNQNMLIEIFSKYGTVRGLEENEIIAYTAPFENIARRKVLWEGGPRNLPIEGQPSSYCKVVDQNYEWMINTALKQLFFYTEPAAFFTREKAEGFIKKARNVQGVFLGNGKYIHPEDYSDDIASELSDWI